MIREIMIKQRIKLIHNHVLGDVKITRNYVIAVF